MLPIFAGRPEKIKPTIRSVDVYGAYPSEGTRADEYNEHGTSETVIDIRFGFFDFSLRTRVPVARRHAPRVRRTRECGTDVRRYELRADYEVRRVTNFGISRIQ